MEKIRLQLAELEAMDIEQLQVLWWRCFKHPPRRLRREYLVAEIGYRIQVKARGSLSKNIRNKLERLAFAEQKVSQPKFNLSAGTKIAREWNGKQHIVTATEGGFEYEGDSYNSLSKIAGEITGARWSGPLFFGLKSRRRKMKKSPKIRCAIYTRKSTEEGLDQEFNSLDAQRIAAEAYIQSQIHEGWELVPTHYDDGGFSGGNMERPALKKLLADIEAKKIDVVIVYKVDRLSRALSDFAKMVEIFDAHNVSFVSVTQQFNTTTSMGRLTLNVLLSFAQFEREVTGERIRDKFAASKKKGMWMGGPQPLGYDVVERKLIVNESEAKIVKFIFEYYANKPKSEPVYKLLDELKTRGYKGKSYITKKGNQVTGQELLLSRIYKILNNPIYNGKITHKSEVYEGEHKAIIDDGLWSKVQSKMNKREFVKNTNKRSEQPKLTGKIFDYLGNKLTATYSYKYSANGRYKMRYYINRQIVSKGKSESEFKRIRAEYIDDIVAAEISQLLRVLITGVVKSDNKELSSKLLKSLKNLLDNPIEFLSRITLYPKHMELLLQLQEVVISDELVSEIKQILNDYNPDITFFEGALLLIKFNIKAQYRRSSGQLHIITANGKKLYTGIESQQLHPNDRTFEMLAKSFYWNKQISIGVYQTPTEICKIENQNIEYVKRAIRQRFLSPKVIERITSNSESSQILLDKLVQFQHWNWQKQEDFLLKSA